MPIFCMFRLFVSSQSSHQICQHIQRQRAALLTSNDNQIDHNERINENNCRRRQLLQHMLHVIAVITAACDALA